MAAGVRSPSAGWRRSPWSNTPERAKPGRASQTVWSSRRSTAASFTLRHHRATHPWSRARPRPSLRLCTPPACRRAVNAWLVNWAPGAVWQRSGRPPGQACSSAATPHRPALVLDSAQDRTDRRHHSRTATTDTHPDHQRISVRAALHPWVIRVTGTPRQRDGSRACPAAGWLSRGLGERAANPICRRRTRWGCTAEPQRRRQAVIRRTPAKGAAVSGSSSHRLRCRASALTSTGGSYPRDHPNPSTAHGRRRLTGGCPGSMRPLCAATERANGGVQPGQLDRSRPDRLVERRLPCLLRLGRGAAPAGQDRRSPCPHDLLPRGHREGMHPLLRGQRIDRPCPTARFQDDLRVQFPTVLSPRHRHRCISHRP